MSENDNEKQNVNPLTILKSLNKAHHNRPSKAKAKERRKSTKLEQMKQIAAIFSKAKGAGIRLNSSYSKE